MDFLGLARFAVEPMDLNKKPNCWATGAEQIASYIAGLILLAVPIVVQVFFNAGAPWPCCWRWRW